MKTLAAELSTEATVAGWRRGVDAGGPANPAGPLFTVAYAEYDLAGAPTRNTQTTFSTCLTPGACCL